MYDQRGHSIHLMGTKQHDKNKRGEGRVYTANPEIPVKDVASDAYFLLDSNPPCTVNVIRRRGGRQSSARKKFVEIDVIINTPMRPNHSPGITTRSGLNG